MDSYHGEIDIAGVELHVDLLVDEGLRILVVVLPDHRFIHILLVNMERIVSEVKSFYKSSNDLKQTRTQFVTPHPPRLNFKSWFYLTFCALDYLK